MIVTTKQLFKQAYGKYALGAYNINNAEQTMGLFRGNMDSKAPFIIQISKGARSYTNKLMLEAMIRAADEIFPDAVFATHLDHGDEATCYDCIESGFYSSVMIDASHETSRATSPPPSASSKPRMPRASASRPSWASWAASRKTSACPRTRPTSPIPMQAVEFIERTGCDSLACAIGTSHGAFKFAGSQGLHFEVVEAIQKLKPGFPLVLHGSSSVPQDEVERINAAGGALKGAKGVDANQYLPAAKLGVCKINIDTDGRLVWTSVHREFFRDKPEVFDFRPIGKVFMEEYAKFIASRNELLGSAGHLDEVRAALKK